jgi:chaperone modulatory protein CbpM
MKVELTDAQWLHEQAEISIDELAELSGLSPDLLRELVDYGALVPVNAQDSSGTGSAPWSFTAECIVAVRTAGRLREDFDLDAHALSIALALIERIQGLEAQLRDLRSQVPQLRVKK